ncbi:DUF2274 domain-containing protein [Bradyrhizobium sp. BR 1433]|uniref:DUF2274 domain-containing protein n=1 Tax=Bradyrhizobium sp. BR 1433 TaxID=3447967 RepID=UPI003EE71773
MPKLRISGVPSDRAVRVTAELPAAVHRDLLAYAEALAHETGQAIDPLKLIAPMLGRFMATDRGFTKLRRLSQARDTGVG